MLNCTQIKLYPKTQNVVNGIQNNSKDQNNVAKNNNYSDSFTRNNKLASSDKAFGSSAKELEKVFGGNYGNLTESFDAKLIETIAKRLNGAEDKKNKDALAKGVIQAAPIETIREVVGKLNDEGKKLLAKVFASDFVEYVPANKVGAVYEKRDIGKTFKLIDLMNGLNDKKTKRIFAAKLAEMSSSKRLGYVITKLEKPEDKKLLCEEISSSEYGKIKMKEILEFDLKTQDRNIIEKSLPSTYEKSKVSKPVYPDIWKIWDKCEEEGEQFATSKKPFVR